MFIFTVMYSINVSKIIKITLTIYFIFVSNIVCDDGQIQQHRHIMELVSDWADIIGTKLFDLSNTMTKKQRLTEAFEYLEDRIYVDNGQEILENAAMKIRTLITKKAQMVEKIAEYAEILSYNRQNDTLFPNSSYNYFKSDYLNVTEKDPEKEEELVKDLRDSECHWWCLHHTFKPIENNSFNRTIIESLFESRHENDVGNCDCENLPHRKTGEDYYLDLPLEYNQHFNESVNLNLSIVQVVPNVYNRSTEVLEGVRWSEPLDLIFKKNFRQDPTLLWQYFASPVGYMRHYPAVKWGTERYVKTYDPRTRSWYTEAMTSPKDMIILLDRSGSVHGVKRILAEHMVNNILDTLNDNDFVNIYTFTNSTEPLVECFADQLVQANEENLRFFRESLPLFDAEFAGDLSLGVTKAYEIFSKYVNLPHAGARCNRAIMLITEGVDYDYQPTLFHQLNKEYNINVRIFTYLIGSEENDARQMEWIACANMGYYVNISYLSEVREKIIPYLTVMSRPINHNYKNKQNVIWSYLYEDLADRRLTNWLWRKYEGIRQREIFLDHVNRERINLHKVLTSSDHMLLKSTHEYEQYKTPGENVYMMTLSRPVYGRREGEVELIGVAGLDVPIKLLRSLIPHHKLGVNGYAFILTNNGYILMHPDHRRSFQDGTIIKPTFNRVDFVEVEILDDNAEPRNFSQFILELRKQIIQDAKKGTDAQQVKFTLDDMKRVIHARRTYHYSKIGPYSLVIALPDKYGLVLVNNTYDKSTHWKNIFKDSQVNNWMVHPDWVYCESDVNTPEARVLDCFLKNNISPLLSSLLFDANVTRWFEEPIYGEESLVNEFWVSKVFMATQSGLTRWRKFRTQSNNFEKNHNRAIDEDWYRRSVEENFHDPHMFLYAVPFEISGYENNTMVTITSSIFVGNAKKKTPVAVTGLQFNHNVLFKLYKNVIDKKIRDEGWSNDIDCFIIDNNAYIVVSSETEYTGRYIGDIRPDIMYHLVENGVFIRTRMYDYQAICHEIVPKKDPNKKAKEKEKRKKKAKKLAKSSGSKYSFTFRKILENMLSILKWIVATGFELAGVKGSDVYQSIKPDTIAFEKLEINKTYPTPCDHEMMLYNIRKNLTKRTFIRNSTNKFVCQWYYVIERIKHSNLYIVVMKKNCNADAVITDVRSPQPTKVQYSVKLPCYIETRYNYSREPYIKCYDHYDQEKELNNEDRRYCGHTE